MQYQRIASRLFNQPLLIHGPALHATMHALGERLGGLNLPDAEMAHYDDRAQRHAGYEVIRNVAVINVHGKTVHRGSGLDAMSGLTSYTGLSAALTQALDDDDVRRIALIVDSPGGEAAGAFDFADRVRAAAGVKGVSAIVSDTALSAGYLIASAASEVAVTRTAATGSVGVVTAHADLSGALNQQGVAVTYVYAGSHKIDGNPYQALPDDVRADMQARIDETYALFVDTVARHRGLSVDAVRATEAQIYQGGAAISVGFADRVSSEADELSRLFAQAQSGASARHYSTPHGGAAMSGPNQSAAGDLAPAPIDPAQLAAAEAAAHAEGVAAGITAERERIGGILRCEAAAGRAEMAATLALDTDMTVEQAGKVLAAAPVPATLESTAHTDFATVMAGVDNPDVGDNTPAAALTDEQHAAALWQGVIAERTA